MWLSVLVSRLLTVEDWMLRLPVSSVLTLHADGNHESIVVGKRDSQPREFFSICDWYVADEAYRAFLACARAPGSYECVTLALYSTGSIKR